MKELFSCKHKVFLDDYPCQIENPTICLICVSYVRLWMQEQASKNMENGHDDPTQVA